MARAFEPSPPQAAFAWADQWSLSAGTERIPLSEAVGRLLAQDLRAHADIPPEARSVRDGYALHAADTLGAGDYSPQQLRLVPATLPVERNCAAGVSDGDPIPPGTDAVLAIDQGDAQGVLLEVGVSLARGDGIVTTGEEYAAGELLLGTGRRLRPQDLAQLAIAGYREVVVYRRPQVRLLLAGHFELDADGPLLASLINRDGGELAGLHVVADATALAEVLQQQDADLTLVAGGTGHGSRDHAWDVLQQCGTVHLDGVAIHPGGGIVLGEAAARPVILLPGAPLACICAYDLVAARALRRMSGRKSALPYRRVTLTLGRKIVSKIGCLDLARLKITGDIADPIATSDGRTLSTTIQADGFLLIPPQSEGYPAGTRVAPYLYDEYD